MAMTLGGGWVKASGSFANGNCVEAGAWRKPAASMANGACAEVGAWRKARGGDSGECAEAADLVPVVAIRDTKEAHLGAARTVLETTAGDWARFLGRVRAGEP